MALVFKKRKGPQPGKEPVPSKVLVLPKDTPKGPATSPLKRDWKFGEFKPPGKFRLLYRLKELAQYIGCTEEEIHILVDAGVGPEPIRLQEPRNYVFQGDSVELWVLGGLRQNYQEPAWVLLKDLWQIRPWGKDKAQRMKYGGPEEVPADFPWPDFTRKAWIE